MIENIKISAFKSINQIEIEGSSLNFFTGTNSSGKSSILQSLLLLSQNLDDSYGLNGPMVSIGSYREARNYNISCSNV